MSDEEEDYPFFGNALDPLDEEDVARQKPVPISEQVARDKQGRRRFHGAFTGGFSAGHFNTVGSEEGWAPATFQSTRTERAEGSRQQRPEDFMDDEDQEVFGIAPRVLRARTEYSKAAPAPSGPLGELLRPVRDSVGARLLSKMGWKQGQGVGPRLGARDKQRQQRQHQEGLKVYGCDMGPFAVPSPPMLCQAAVPPSPPPNFTSPSPNLPSHPQNFPSPPPNFPSLPPNFPSHLNFPSPSPNFLSPPPNFPSPNFPPLNIPSHPLNSPSLPPNFSCRPQLVTLNEKVGDLFSSAPHVSLAHCVGQDLLMKKGIARQFRQKYRHRDLLLKQKKGVGEVGVGVSGCRYIFYLITKPSTFDFSPDIVAVRKCLVELRKLCVALGVKELAMPRISSGLDQLQWSTVKQLIFETFRKTAMTITIYRLPDLLDFPKLMAPPPRVTRFDIGLQVPVYWMPVINHAFSLASPKFSPPVLLNPNAPTFVPAENAEASQIFSSPTSTMSAAISTSLNSSPPPSISLNSLVLSSSRDHFIMKPPVMYSKCELIPTSKSPVVTSPHTYSKVRPNSDQTSLPRKPISFQIMSGSIKNKNTSVKIFEIVNGVRKVARDFVEMKEELSAIDQSEQRLNLVSSPIRKLKTEVAANEIVGTNVSSQCSVYPVQTRTDASKEWDTSSGIKEWDTAESCQSGKVYGCDMGPFNAPVPRSSSPTPSSDSSDDEVTFAPEDLPALLVAPKTNTFGLGYSGLDRTPVLSGHVNLFEPPVRNEKGTTLGIRGKGFGVGAFETEDADIYGSEDMSRYDFSLETTHEARQKIRDQRHRDKQKQQPSVSDCLAGFVRSAQPVSSLQHFPAPLLPRGYVPQHAARQSRFSEPTVDVQDHTRRGLGRHDLGPSERSILLGEPSPRLKKTRVSRFSDVPPCVDLENEPPCVDLEPPERVQLPETPRLQPPEPPRLQPPEPPRLQPPVNVAVMALQPGQFSPFSHDPSKQTRYQQFLTLTSEGRKDLLVSVQPASMTEWERSRELSEFEQAARLYQPLAGPISERFVSSATLLGHEEKPHSDVPPVESSVSAAKLGMFGKLTRTREAWQPCSLLCKRFNVPEPNSEAPMSSAKRRRPTFSVFDFLEAAPPPSQPSRTAAGGGEAAGRGEGAETGGEGAETGGEGAEKGGEGEEEGDIPAKKTTLLEETKDPPDRLDLYKAIFLSSSEGEGDDEPTLQPAEPPKLRNTSPPRGVFANLDQVTTPNIPETAPKLPPDQTSPKLPPDQTPPKLPPDQTAPLRPQTPPELPPDIYGPVLPSVPPSEFVAAPPAPPPPLSFPSKDGVWVEKSKKDKKKKKKRSHSKHKSSKSKKRKKEGKKKKRDPSTSSSSD